MALSLEQLAQRVRKEPDWIVKGFLKRQNTAFIFGPPKRACKSWLILSGCWDLSEGKPMWGIRQAGGYIFEPPRALRCVYFTQEDTEDDAHDRLDAMLAGRRGVNDRVWIVPKNLQVTLDTVRGRALIQQELDDIKDRVGDIDLVAFDPMRRMHHGDENDSVTIVELWGVIDRIHQRYNCSTLFAHHTVKPPRDPSNFDPTDPFTGRGSGDIYGGGDAFVVVLPGAGNDDYRKVGLYFETKRGKPLAPAQMKITFAQGRVEHLGGGWEKQEGKVE